MPKEIVHCIEMSPGVYMVSAQFMAELEKQAQKTTWKGSIFGVEIRESKHLPMIIEKTKEKMNEKATILPANEARTRINCTNKDGHRGN